MHVVARKYGLTPSWVWLNRVLTFLAATVAWVFFRATSMRSAADVLAAMVGLKGVSGARHAARGAASSPPSSSAACCG